MGATSRFEVRATLKGKAWDFEGKYFRAIIYVPNSNVPGEVINFSMDMPYLIVLPEDGLVEDKVIEFAENSGLANVARLTGGSVVFIYPTCEGGWENADEKVFQELIENSKIGPVYSDGILENIDRFGNNPTDYYIRGAIFKTYLYGFGKSADYIAKNLLDTIEGQYLWGPGEITPAGVSLEKLSILPNLKRNDIPILSVGNTIEINEALKKCDNLLVVADADYENNYHSFMKKHMRWCGDLKPEPDYALEGMINEYGIETVKTSPDNTGEFADTSEHKVGYVAWYNEGLVSKETKVPTLIVNHGGGDSALYIAKVSGWWEIAHKYNFLLISVENHTSVTATETIELIDKLKGKYNIDENRLYASGFSMGGCKTWDLMQEYPERFAALAPMDATFEVGFNFFGKPAQRVNMDVSVPVFYAGGELTPLPELPFQADKCTDRIRYLFETNRAKTKYVAKFSEHELWSNSIWGVDGDRVEKYYDASRNAMLTVLYFENEDGVENIALASIDNQGHECRVHTCEQAWKFMSQFSIED